MTRAQGSRDPTGQGRGATSTLSSISVVPGPSSADDSGELVVCEAADLLSGGRIEISGAVHFGVTVFNVDGELYALLNHCPHMGGPLCRGRIRPRVSSDAVGRWDFDREGEVVKCPFHNWEFDICSGQALHDSRLRVRRYPVEIRDGKVVVKLRKDGRKKL
ncbi:MAG: (2Fe-2S)-binding protein [Chloroflexi bacterium]|nr:(2Fe-2S)-binding protein [Chloroflexota bacterium]HCU72530.1 (2Fe-2S)-binding protein [Chloroflexota bacterium]|tara:strand:- start:6873 stop:7355 length:483 start_codon:yes stop_codon:yes gene_type:complete